MSRLEISEQAQKILERERTVLQEEAKGFQPKAMSSGSILSSICKLLNARGRYFAIMGEHFSVQDYDGLMVIDALDEEIIRHVHLLLRSYLEHERIGPNTQAVALLSEKLLPDIKEMPKYPVAYRILYVIRHAFDEFEKTLDSNPGFDLHELEAAFIHHLLGIIDRYVQTREKPGMRHFSDVAREYDVVTRMKCRCGEDQYHVKLQSLKQSSDGHPYDALDLECKACGHTRSVTFDLPNFKDLYQT